MKSRTAMVLLVVLSVVLLVSPAMAEEMGDSIYVGGFVSQGYLNTRENNYLVPRSVNGTSEFTEAAITVLARPVDRLRVGIQLLARNFGDIGNDFVSVDWAYGDYLYRDWLGVRLGKVKMPYGFYNEGRDVDVLRTSIFLPQSIYDERRRDFILAYEGIGGYGNVALGDVGELDYHVFGGTLNVPDPTSGFWHDVYTQAGVDLEDAVADLVSDETGYPATAKFDELRDQVVSFPWIYGGALNWHTPLEGLRLGASGMQARFNFQGKIRYDVFVDTGTADHPSGLPVYVPQTLAVDETEKIHHIVVFGAEYLRDRWSLATEYFEEYIGTGSDHGWYLQGGWQATERWAFGAYYSIAEPEASYVAELDLPEYYGWQRDLALSARVDLLDHWLFKVEYHFYDGVAQVRPSNLSQDSNNFSARYWGMFTAKTTFHF